MPTKKESGAELVRIQTAIKAPKNQYNKFGGYNYRSCEDIMEAVKPLLLETGCTLVVSDEVVLVGERYYVKATATLTAPGGEQWCNTAYAREAADKKGMDAAQVTGAASSYARKYALSGLLCLDDNKDADVTNTNAEPPKQPKPAAQTQQTKAVTIETIKEWIAHATEEKHLVAVWGKTPDELKAQVQPLLTAKKNELRGGAS